MNETRINIVLLTKTFMVLLLMYFSVGCVDSLNSPYPGLVSTDKTPADSEDYIAAPTDLKITQFNQNQIFGLWWSDNSENEAGFEVWRKSSESEEFELLVILTENATAYNDTLQNLDLTYIYKIRAFNSITYSGYSNEVNATQNIGLAAPSELQGVVIPSTNNINLTWIDNSTNELGFIIERQMISEYQFAEITRVGPNNTSWIDNSASLQPGLTAIYRVKSYNSVEHSNYSNIFSITL